jgi:hypothetical protein
LRQRFGGRLVAHVVVAGDAEELDLRIQFGRDAFVLRHLRGIAGFVDEVAGNHHERRFEPVRGGHGELEIGRFLREILIFGVHAELRVRHLEKGLSGQRAREGQGQEEAS